jgi:hypothetical protein
MKMNTKKFGMLTLLVVLVIGVVLANTVFAQSQPWQLHQRYQEIKAEAQRLANEGYDVAELLKLDHQIKEAYQEKNFQSVEKLLKKAEQTLRAIKDSREIPLGGELPIPEINEPILSPFGVAFGEGSSNLDNFMEYIHDLGVSRTKVSFFWHKLEPKDDSYNWKELDEYLDQLQPGDKALLNVFTTGWATNRESPKGATFKNEECKEKYREFIVDLVEHTQGKITYWQRDTEPASPKHYPADRFEEYVEAQKIFYEAVKSVQPDAIVIGVNANGNFKNGEHVSADFFDYVIHYGKDYFDLLDVRLYQDKYDIPMRVEWFRNKMKQYGYEKPIVCTEFGGPDPREFPEQYQSLSKVLRQIYASGNIDEAFTKLDSMREEGLVPPEIDMFLVNTSPELEEKRNGIHCRDIVQRHLIMLGTGVQEMWYWNLQSSGVHPIFSKTRLMDPEGWDKLPPYYCYQRMVQQIGNVKVVKRVSTENENIYLFNLTMQDESTKYVIWERRDMFHGEDQPATPFELGTDWQKARVTDVFGNEEVKITDNGVLLLHITDTPLYIECELSGYPGVHQESKNVYLATRIPVKTQAQIDFVNGHYDYVMTSVLSVELREKIQGPRLFLYRSIQGTWTNFRQFDWDHIDSNENMFCHHKDSRIKTIWTSWLMDGSDLVEKTAPDALNHWVNYYAATASDQVNSFNYDGLFIDSATHNLWSGAVYNFMPDNYSSVKWREGRYRALEFIKSYFPDRIVIFNGLHSGNGAEHSLALTDGGLWETFAFRSETGKYQGEDKWKKAIELAERNKEDKYIGITSKKPNLIADLQSRIFILASYLMVGNQNVALTMIDMNYDQLKSIYYFPEYEIDLGVPLSNFSFNEQNLYERKFEKGLVLVNPNDTESYIYYLDRKYYRVIPIGGGVLQEDGTCEGSLTYESVDNEIVLSPISGIVLINK